MRHSTLFKKTIALTAALCFCAHSSGLAQVLPAVNPRVNFGQPPVLKYLSVNSANPFNYFNFLLGVNPQVKENLDREAEKLINYFFLGVTLPNHTLWVNLRPDEPERIASEELAKTDMGRVLLEEDLQLKKDVAKYLHPANAKGKEFWEKLYAAIGKDSAKKMKIATSNRVWIVPDEAVVVETEDGVLVASAKLKVLSENEYLKENPQDETQAVMEKLMKEIILPALTDEINSGPAYAPLRQIYHSLILAEWFKRKHKSSASAFALSINRGYTNGLESELPWAKQKIWQEYVDSYQKSEYKLQDTLFGLRRMYWSGGIVMDWAGQGTTTGLSGTGTLGTGGSVGTASPLKVMGLADALENHDILDKIKVDFARGSTVAVIGGTDPTFRNEMPRLELKIVSAASPSMKKNLASLGLKRPAPERIFISLKPVLKYKPAELYFEDDLPGLIVLQPAFGKVLAHNFIIAKYHAGEISGGELAFLFAHELAELENSDNVSVFQNIKNTFSGLFKPEKEKIEAVKQKEHNMDWRAVELIEKEGHSIEDAVSMLKRTPELFDEAEKAGLIKGRIKDRETHPSIGARIEYILSRKKEFNLFAPGNISGEGLKIKNALADFISKPLEFFPREKIYLYQMNKFISSLPVEYDSSFLDPKNDFNLKESLGEIGKNASDAVNFFYKEDYLKEKGILRPQGYAGKIEASFKIEEDNLKISFIDNGLSPEQLTSDDKVKYGGLGGLGEGLSAVERSLNKVGGRLSALIKDDGRKEIVLDIPLKNLRLKNAAAGSPMKQDAQPASLAVELFFNEQARDILGKQPKILETIVKLEKSLPKNSRWKNESEIMTVLSRSGTDWFVAMKEGQFVGYALYNHELGTLSRLVVTPQQTGYGTQLLDQVLRNLSISGIEKIKIFPTLDSESFYRNYFAKRIDWKIQEQGGFNKRGLLVAKTSAGSSAVKVRAVNRATDGLNNEFGERTSLLATEAEKGGIDLSKIELTLKDEKYVSSLNAADVKILRATRALNQGWDSLALLHIHEIISFVKYDLIKDLTQKAAILELLSRLSQRQELDEEASRFFTVLQASQDLREVKLAFN